MICIISYTVNLIDSIFFQLYCFMSFYVIGFLICKKLNYKIYYI